MEVHNGDCLAVLRTLKSNTLDSLVTDPPAGINFMGKDWDKDKGGRDAWIAWMTEVMTEAMRVLKPGAHGLVWALPRTSHWTATALENAGFEVRDVVTHLFGTGFPKSQNIALAIDKQTGAIGNRGKGFNAAGKNIGLNQNKELRSDHPDYVAPDFVTEEAKQWSGWGTALKPASEHWILVRKKGIVDPCEEIVLSAIPNTQLTMHGLQEAEALLVRILVDSNLNPDQQEKILQLGRAVNGLDMTAMSLLAKSVDSIDLNTVSSWKNISDADLEKVKTFITSMVTKRITESRISNYSQSQSMPNATSLVPSSEHYILIRKPCSEKTVAANVLRWNTGALNIDVSRVTCNTNANGVEKDSKENRVTNQFSVAENVMETQEKEGSTTHLDPSTKLGMSDSDIGTTQKESIATSSSIDTSGERPFLKDTLSTTGMKTDQITGSKTSSSCSTPTTSDTTWESTQTTKSGKQNTLGVSANLGRWPSNLILDEAAAEMLDEQSGYLGISRGGNSKAQQKDIYSKFKQPVDGKDPGYGDSGGASRFFYVAKASKADRNAGLEGMPDKEVNRYSNCEQGNTAQQTPRKTIVEKNHHPTVKNTKLMEYLITLVTPPGGTVLDPFMGSGSTGVAAKKLGFSFVGIEKEQEYFDIARKRIMG
jgi:hypothetical protein